MRQTSVDLHPSKISPSSFQILDHQPDPPDLRQAWKHSKGQGVRIAFLCSGIDLSHSALSGRSLAPIDLLDKHHQQDPLLGTAIAGLLNASLPNHPIGWAPKSHLLPIISIPKTQPPKPRLIAQAILKAIQLHAKILILPIHSYKTYKSIQNAITKAHKHKLLLFSPSPLHKLQQHTFPSNLPEIISSAPILPQPEQLLPNTNIATDTQLLAPAIHQTTLPNQQLATIQGPIVATTLAAASAALALAIDSSISKREFVTIAQSTPGISQPPHFYQLHQATPICPTRITQLSHKTSSAITLHKLWAHPTIARQGQKITASLTISNNSRRTCSGSILLQCPNQNPKTIPFKLLRPGQSQALSTTFIAHPPNHSKSQLLQLPNHSTALLKASSILVKPTQFLGADAWQHPAQYPFWISKHPILYQSTQIYSLLYNPSNQSLEIKILNTGNTPIHNPTLLLKLNHIAIQQHPIPPLLPTQTHSIKTRISPTPRNYKQHLLQILLLNQQQLLLQHQIAFQNIVTSRSDFPNLETNSETHS